MSQASMRPCSRCGKPALPNQRFCPNCGSPVQNEDSNPAGQGKSMPPTRHTPHPAYSQQTPLPPSYPSQKPLQSQKTALPYSQLQERAKKYRSSLADMRTALIATPAKAASKEVVQKERRTGCTIGVISLLVTLILVTGGFFTINFVASHLSGVGGLATPTPAPITTTPINATLTYAGVVITIVDVRQSASFPDDVNLISAPGEVRLDIVEHNTVANPVGTYTYREAAHIVLPTSKSVGPINANDLIAPASTEPRTNWIDFPVPMNTNVSELL